jgi:multidrug transporter EmrE-like cation transporter
MSSSKGLLVLGIFTGVIAYVTLYLGKGIQKYAIEGLKIDKKVKSKHSGIWIFGTILTALFVFIQWIPLSVLHTPMNLIAPLEGIGLITLLIYSAFALKEKISILEGIGIFFIVLGTVLINVVAITPEELQRESLNLMNFGISLSVIVVVFALLFLIVFRKSKTLTGVVLGLAAGCFMAFQTLAKRITDIEGLVAIFTFVMFAFAIATLGLTQWALVKARANVVVPSFTSASIILTTLLGIFVIDESIFKLQISGIVCIVLGIIVMNLLQKDKQKELETPIETPTIDEGDSFQEEKN